MDTEYRKIHKKLSKVKGKAKEHKCIDCGRQAVHWSYSGLDPKQKISDSGWPFSLDLAYYSPRCISCHRTRDMGDRCKKGHDRSYNTIFDSRGSRQCKQCIAETQAIKYQRSRM